jgi:hypothetical protein
VTSVLFVYSNIELTRARLKKQYGRSCLHRARNARSRKEKELVRSLAIYFVQTFIFTFRALVYIRGSWESSFLRIRNLFVFTSQEPLRFLFSPPPPPPPPLPRTFSVPPRPAVVLCHP